MSKIFDSIKVSDEIKRYLDHSFDVVDQIHEILERKGMTQRDLANLLGKKESEVSKWMRGTHNFTLKSIAKIESVLDASVLLTPMQAREMNYTVKMVPVQVMAHANNRQLATETSALSAWEGDHEVYTGGLKSA